MPSDLTPRFLYGDPTADLHAAPKRYVDTQVATREASANKSVAGARVPNGYIGADSNGSMSPALQYSATTTVYGVIRLGNGGDLGGTAGAPTVPALANKVDIVPTVFQAGNITGTWNPSAANGIEQEATLTGDTTIGAGPAAANGQKMFIALNASGASRVLTFATAVGPAAGYPTSVQIPVGKQVWLIYRYTTSSPGARWEVIAVGQEA